MSRTLAHPVRTVLLATVVVAAMAGVCGGAEPLLPAGSCPDCVIVAVDLDPNAPGFQTDITVEPGTQVIPRVTIWIYHPTATANLYDIGYVGGLNRGIAFGHTPDEALNTGEVVAVTATAVEPVIPGHTAFVNNGIEKMFAGAELQYFEYGSTPGVIPAGVLSRRVYRRRRRADPRPAGHTGCLALGRHRHGTYGGVARLDSLPAQLPRRWWIIAPGGAASRTLRAASGVARPSLGPRAGHGRGTRPAGSQVPHPVRTLGRGRTSAARLRRSIRLYAVIRSSFFARAKDRVLAPRTRGNADFHADFVSGLSPRLRFYGSEVSEFAE